jgi:hypothetical protein
VCRGTVLVRHDTGIWNGRRRNRRRLRKTSGRTGRLEVHPAGLQQPIGSNRQSRHSSSPMRTRRRLELTYCLRGLSCGHYRGPSQSKRPGARRAHLGGTVRRDRKAPTPRDAAREWAPKFIGQLPRDHGNRL